MARITAENFDAVLSADAVRRDIQGKSVRSGFARVAAQLVQFVLGFGSAILLARLIAPDQFGIRDMVVVLMAFVGSFQDFGLPLAVSNREEVDHVGMSRVFWVNLWLNVGIALFMLAMTPVMAFWFQEPALLAATPLMALSVFVLGTATQPKALLSRQMRHGALTVVETGSLIIGLVTAVVLALLGYGYWALLWQIVAAHVTKSVGMWVACGWLPAGPRASRASRGLRDLFRYSSNVTAYSVIAHVGRNLDRFLIGRFGGATNMGLYGRAYQWSLFPLQQAYTPLLNVAVSGLSRVQHEPARYRAYFKRGMLPMYAIIFPALIFMLVEAHNVVLLVLGQQWAAAIPLFRVLCVSALFESVNRITKWLYLSQGETRRQLRWGLVYTPLMIAAVVLGAQWGTIGVAWGFTLGTAVLTFPGLAYCLRTSHITLRDFLEILWRPTAAALAAAGVLVALGALLPTYNVFLNLLLRAPIFGVVYAIVWLATPGGWSTAQQVLKLLTVLKPTR